MLKVLAGILLVLLAALAAIFGGFEPSGTLPVNIPVMGTGLIRINTSRKCSTIPGEDD